VEPLNKAIAELQAKPAKADGEKVVSAARTVVQEGKEEAPKDAKKYLS